MITNIVGGTYKKSKRKETKLQEKEMEKPANKVGVV
jgi:hypothetical protein